MAIALYRLKPLIDSTTTPDPTWDNTRAATFSYLEITMGTMASCLPTLRPLIVKLLPSVRDLSHRHDKHLDSDPYTADSRDSTVVPISKQTSKHSTPTATQDATDAIIRDIEFGGGTHHHSGRVKQDLGYHVAIASNGPHGAAAPADGRTGMM
jgi:hypothetical protein